MRAGSFEGRSVEDDVVRFRSTFGKRTVFRLFPLVLVSISAALGFASSTYVIGWAGILVVAVAQAIWLVCGTSYRVGRGSLVTRWVWRKREMPLAAIVGVRRIAYADSWGMMPLANDFAMGTDVLEIRFDGHPSVYVSPHGEDAFLAAIGSPVVENAQHWAG